MSTWYEKKWFRVAMRFVRVAGAGGIAIVIAEVADNELYIGLTPVIAALFKWLRDSWPKVFEKLPV